VGNDGQLPIDAAVEPAQAALMDCNRIDAVVREDAEEIVVLIRAGERPVGEGVVQGNEKKGGFVTLKEPPQAQGPSVLVIVYSPLRPGALPPSSIS